MVSLRDCLLAMLHSPLSTKESFKQPMDCYSRACRDFSLTTSTQKTTVMGLPPHIIIEYIIITLTYYYFMNLMRLSTNSSTSAQSSLIRSLVKELISHIGQTATTFARLIKRVWSNYKFTQHTKVQMCRARVLSTPLCQ